MAGSAFSLPIDPYSSPRTGQSQFELNGAQHTSTVQTVERCVYSVSWLIISPLTGLLAPIDPMQVPLAQKAPIGLQQVFNTCETSTANLRALSHLHKLLIVVPKDSWIPRRQPQLQLASHSRNHRIQTLQWLALSTTATTIQRSSAVT